jgi:hypothetical protein
MRRSVAWILFALLGVIAGLHIYWGFGGLWPADTLRGLIDTVMGDPRMTEMPPVWGTLIVAALIFAAGYMALERAGIVSVLPNWMVRLGAWVLVAVFALRGLSSFLFAGGVYGNGLTLSEPFATYDVWIYGPLCLLIAAGFLFLILSRPRT